MNRGHYWKHEVLKSSGDGWREDSTGRGLALQDPSLNPGIHFKSQAWWCVFCKHSCEEVVTGRSWTSWPASLLYSIGPSSL